MISEQELFRALGVETNHKILVLLLKGEHCACEIPSRIGKTQSNTSMHLAKLTQLELVKSRRDGKKILYTIKDKRVAKLFAAVRTRK
jgi:ArsR family transcriptional regulator, lead/cadmium/zinc/bismuth-responsive transcriptional repressor